MIGFAIILNLKDFKLLDLHMESLLRSWPLPDLLMTNRQRLRFYQSNVRVSSEDRYDALTEIGHACGHNLCVFDYASSLESRFWESRLR